MSISKKIIACILVATTSIGTIAFAGENKNALINKISTVDNLETQLNKLYTTISKKTGLDKYYIKQLYNLAGAEIIYADKQPDIYIDQTVKSFNAPMEIIGANTIYRKLDENSDIVVDSKYYLPDAMYSVSYDIASIMSLRLYYNRGTMQECFDNLTDATKKDILFYESVLLYTGESVEAVDSLYQAYLEMLIAKNKNEYVVEYSDNGTPSIKDSFQSILNTNETFSDNSLKLLATMLSFDRNLAVNDKVGSIESEYTLPYISNYTSRENMMLAAASLVGKVRYVWGGGHSGASCIDGINPSWEEFESLYPSTPTSEIINTTEDGKEYTSLVNNEGFGTCIKPSGSWCPLHDNVYSAFHGETVYSYNDYITLRKGLYDSINTKQSAYESTVGQMNFSHGINAHSIEGLDCSGFVSWLYNQITDDYNFNSTAKEFTNQYGIEEVPFGEDLLPGDEFSWTSHIIAIVGKVKEDSKAYVTVEQTPNQLKYGVCYYDGASSSDIETAKQIASEANELIGDIDSSLEAPHCYCMNNMGKYTETIEVKVRQKKNINKQKDAEDIQENNKEDSNSEEIENEEIINETSTEDSTAHDTETSTTEDGSEVSKIDSDIITTEDTNDSDNETTEDIIDNSSKENNAVDNKDSGKEKGNTKEKDEESSTKSDNKQDKHNETTTENKKTRYKIVTKTVEKQYISIGRFREQFVDDNLKVIDDKVTIKDATALEIIQHTLTKLPLSYVSGYGRYDGDLFNKELVASNVYIRHIN